MRRQTRLAILTLTLALGSISSASLARAAGEAPSIALSSEVAQRAQSVSGTAPTISAPPTATVAEGQTESLTATATDADAGDLLTITETGAPAGLTFSHVPSTSPATATLSGTMGAADVGSWTIQWSVTDGTFTAGTTTALTVTQNDPPIVTAPSFISSAVAQEIEFPVTASDPDGDPIDAFFATGSPAGATFTPNSFKTSGVFAWIPAAGQEGDYTVTFTASALGQSGVASTGFHIAAQDHPPVITGPASVSGFVNSLLTINVTVSDPDGDAITSLALGNTQMGPPPEGMTFTTNADNTAGTIHWTPTGPFHGDISIVAISGPFGAKTIKVIAIVITDRAPVVTAPATLAAMEGVALVVNVSASDPDGEAINSLTAAPIPFGASFTTNAAHTSGTLNWTPDFTQAGSYPIVFAASNARTGSATTTIAVANVNRAPAADANGPYSGVVNIPVAFDGTGSSDPDGDPLTYMWDFGDGSNGTGDKPSHVYAAGGSYPVTLTVTDNGTPPMSGAGTTTASIVDVFDARVFTSGGNKAIRLGSGKPTWCASVEPINDDFSLTDVDLNSIVLEYGGNQISALTGKSSISSDSDHNGIDEIGICFGKDALRTLFSGLPNGRTTVTVMVEGNLAGGAKFSGSAQVDVQSSGAALAASLSPNPFNPSAVLTFKTEKSGPVRVRLYDMNGRLVRTLLDLSDAPAGYHDVRVDGHGEAGERLASGVYFYRIDTAEGQVVGRASILK